MTGLAMTKTKAQRGILEPITHVRKPRCIQVEMGEEQVGSTLAACNWPRMGGAGGGPAWLWSENCLGWRPLSPGGPAPCSRLVREVGRGPWGCSGCAAAMGPVVIRHLECG